MYYIYILYSPSADIYYIGHTNDPEVRLGRHLANSTEKFTGKYQNWKMVALFEVSENKGEAMRLEAWLKKQKSRKLIEKLIDPDFVPEGKLAQLVRVPYIRG